MYYGDEKVRQMARSILSSTRRKGARDDLRIIKKRSRSRIRQELRHVLRDEDYEADDDVDLLYYPDEQIRRVVWERRAADKLAHFERWAIEVTRDIPEPDGRLAAMRGMLPKGLIGDHAISHLRGYDEFRTDRFAYGRSAITEETPAERRARWQAEREAEHVRRVRLLREIVVSGWGHRLLNKAMSHHTVYWPVWTLGVPRVSPDGRGGYMTIFEDRFVDTPQGPTRARYLTGLGDVEQFLADLKAAASVSSHVAVEEQRIERRILPNRYYFGKREHLPRHTYVHEVVVKTRPNPAYHPEWLKSVLEFLALWESTRGDRRVLMAKKPWP